MPVLSYSRENIEKYDFENKILKGIKKHTIRRYRKRLFQVGDILYHYKNWRTPQVKKICENKCLYVADIEIYKLQVNQTPLKFVRFKINKKIIWGTKLLDLAKNDGFSNYVDFVDFFIKVGLPFYGQIIGWGER